MNVSPGSKVVDCHRRLESVLWLSGVNFLIDDLHGRVGGVANISAVTRIAGGADQFHLSDACLASGFGEEGEVELDVLSFGGLWIDGDLDEVDDQVTASEVTAF